MTFEQVRLVRKTFLRIANVSPELIGGVFFHRLFAIAPDVRPLFSHSSLPEQSHKLMALLTYVVDQLNSLDTIVEEVSVLAQYHQRSGVTHHHYTIVGQALLWTLEQALGADWTPDVSEAWKACYGLLADTMLKATRPVLYL